MTSSAVADEGALVDLSKAFMDAAEGLATLVDLEDDSAALWILLTQAEDATWTDDERADLEQRLAVANAQLLTKVEHYAGLIRKLEKLAENDDDEIDRVKARRDRKRKSAAWLRQNLLDHMHRTEQSRIETHRYTVSIAINPPAVQVLEPMMVPATFKREKVEVVIDKRAILDHVKQTGEIPEGCDITRAERISIS